MAKRNQLISFWIGAFICGFGAVGLWTQLSGPKDDFFGINNISTIEIGATCQVLSDMYVVFDFEDLTRSDRFDVFIGLERPFCEGVTLSIDGGVRPGDEFGTRGPTYGGSLQIGDFRGLTTIASSGFFQVFSDGETQYRHTYALPERLWENVEQTEHEVAFDLSEIDGRVEGEGILYLRARFQGVPDGDLTQTDVVRRVSAAKQRVLALLYLDTGDAKVQPKVYTQFPSELDVLPLSARIQDEGFFHGGGAKVFSVQPTTLDSFTSRLVLSERDGDLWGLSYDVVSLAAEQRVTGLIVLFSALIGVGASLMFESILSLELLRRIRGD